MLTIATEKAPNATMLIQKKDSILTATTIGPLSSSLHRTSCLTVVLRGDSLVSQSGEDGRKGDDKDAVKPVFTSVNVTVPSFIFIFTFLRSCL
jgi:hypothetical protein